MTPVPPFERESTFNHWNRFAAVTGEFSDLHQDDEFARQAGQTGAFAPYSAQWSYAHSFLRQAFPGRKIRSVDLRFQRPAYRGTKIRVEGEIDGAEGTDVAVSIRILDGEGQVLATGKGVVAAAAVASARNADAIRSAASDSVSPERMSPPASSPPPSAPSAVSVDIHRGQVTTDVHGSARDSRPGSL